MATREAVVHAEAPAAGPSDCGGSTGGAPEAASHPLDPNDLKNDFCEVCQTGGRLLLCDRCPRAFHVRCIERFVELEGLEQCSEWRCPVCQHGVDILRGRAKQSASVEQMQARMSENLRRNRRQRLAAVRRRDLFLSDRLDLVQDFASSAALRRLQAADRRGLPALDIGASVDVAGSDGQLYRAFVALQTGASRYVVVDAETQAEAEVLREDVSLATAPAAGPAPAPDFLGLARKPVLSEGTKLKDYQATGVNWLLHSIHNRCGGILADDMGLGKTVQTLAALSFLQCSGAVPGPFLIVCPLSCAGNWLREAKRFVPHMSTAKVCGSGKEREYCFQDDEVWYGMKDLIITTYETLTSTEEFFQRQVWSVIVLDEAQRIKNEGTRIRESLNGIQSASRVLLTGTPLQNNMMELFALLRWLWPDVLSEGSEAFANAVQFTGGDQQPLDFDTAAAGAQVDTEQVEKIQLLLGLLMLRRRKEDVITLPPKALRDIWLPMTPCQVSWYKTLLRCRTEVQAIGLRALLKLMVRLRQLSGHPRCLAYSQADREGLLMYSTVKAEELEKLTSGPRMSEDSIAESGKLLFLDMLLGQLHAQNMAFSEDWRKAFDDRRKNTGDIDNKKPRRSSVKDWLKKADGILFLDEMRPWVAPAAPAPPAGSAAEAAPDVGGGAGAPAQPVPAEAAAKEAQPEEAGDTGDVPRPHKVLIFSQFHACLDMLEAFCAFRGWRCLRLDGSTSRVLRELDMRDFNSDDEDYFVYLIGTRAGGLGINLASANHVVLFDQDWNPHVDLQAIDRAHRIGQRRVVNIYRLVQEWGVEEKLIHRQEQKLQMERCVIEGAGKAEGAAALEASERLSAEEIVNFLRFGERALQRFAGESMAGWTLQAMLDKKRLPLPVPDDPGGAGLPAGAAGAEFVEDDGEGGSHLLQEQREDEEDAAEAAPAPPPPPRPPPPRPAEAEDDELVRRTSSGRAVKAPKLVYVPTELVKKPRVQKDLLKHCRTCFGCGEGALPTTKGRKRACDLADGAAAGEARGADCFAAVDTFCNTCPRAYHRACLGQGELISGRWSCPWHRCGSCSRSAASCGGMLIHCLHCPSALCYDCFPPNFRRVYPADKFWTDMWNRGWKVTSQKMVFFKCNACRALEEQKRRLQMRVEDLEAEKDEQKRQALEEQRSLVSKKKREEELEAKRRHRQVVLQHERDKLEKALQADREELSRAAEALWPPRFRAKWLACCKSESQMSKLVTAIGRKPVRAVNTLSTRLQLALEVCTNCGFPGHEASVCPSPAEILRESSDAPGKDALEEAGAAGQARAKGAGRGGGGGRGRGAGSGSLKQQARKKVCGHCRAQGHSRVQCQHLPAEQRSEYEVRRESFGKLAGMLRSAATLAEPQGLAGADEKSLLQSWKETKFRVKEAVFDMLRSCDLGHLIREAPAVCVEPGDDADDAGGAAASGPPRRSAAKGKAKAQAKPQPKIWGKRPAPAEEKGLQQRPQRAKRKGPPVSAAGPIQSLLKTLGRFKDEEDARSRGGAPRPKAKAATTRNGADTEVELTSGPAKGWSVKVAPAGGGSLYRQPEAKRWLTSLIVKARLEAAGESPAVFAALKAQSSAMQKDVTQRSRARGRSDAVGGAGAKHSGQAGSGQKPQQEDLQQAREIIDGPATSWILRGKMNSQGTVVFNYKRPGEDKWKFRKDAFVDIGVEVIAALDDEKQDMLQVIKAKKADAQRGDGAPARPPPKRRKLANQASGPSQCGAAAAAGSGAAPQREVLRITRGAAAGWSVRCAPSQLEPLAWEFQRPNGGTWERLPALQEAGLAEDLVVALRSEQEALAGQVGQMLQAPPRGEGEGGQSPVHLGSPRDVGDSPGGEGRGGPERMPGGLAQPPEVAPEPPCAEATSLRGRRRTPRPDFPLLKPRQHNKRQDWRTLAGVTAESRARALAPRRSDESEPEPVE